MSFDENNQNLLTMLANQAIPVSPDQPLEISDITEHPSWQYDTLTFNTIWEGNHALPMVLRTYRSRLTYWQTQDDQIVNRVWAVLRRLRLDNFPSPHPMARGQLGQTDFLLWHTIPGHRPEADEVSAIVPQLAELLARVHALNHDGLNNEPLYQATIAGTLVRMLLWSREMDNPQLKEMINRLKPTVSKIQGWQHKLIHGDPRPENTIAAEGKITALLNWENAAIGDPRWDVMTAAHALRPFGAEQAEQLVNWYETFTGKTIDQRPFWYAMVSVRLWALKSWLAHAVQTEAVSPECNEWTQDVSAAQEVAIADLTSAGL